MNKIKTFESFLLECGKGDKGYKGYKEEKEEKKEKKEKCPECGKKMKNCECDK